MLLLQNKIILKYSHAECLVMKYDCCFKSWEHNSLNAFWNINFETSLSITQQTFLFSPNPEFDATDLLFWTWPSLYFSFMDRHSQIALMWLLWNRFDTQTPLHIYPRTNWNFYPFFHFWDFPLAISTLKVIATNRCINKISS